MCYIAFLHCFVENYNTDTMLLLIDVYWATMNQIAYTFRASLRRNASRHKFIIILSSKIYIGRSFEYRTHKQIESLRLLQTVVEQWASLIGR